jgi:hypothetical protein
MTTDKNFARRNRDMQDNMERHVFSRLEHTDAGAIVSVKGTGGTEDIEMPVLYGGYGFNLEDDTNAEVIAVEVNSDSGLKYAIMSLPRDKQHKWAKGHGGIQNPLDPERRIEFEKDGVWIKEGVAFLGDEKQVKVTVSGGTLSIEFDGTVDFKCDQLTHNGKNIGDDHKHSGVETGGSNTGNPV